MLLGLDFLFSKNYNKFFRLRYIEVDLRQGRRIFIVVSCKGGEKFLPGGKFFVMNFDTKQPIQGWDILEEMDLLEDKDSITGARVMMDPIPDGPEKTKIYYQFESVCRKDAVHIFPADWKVFDLNYRKPYYRGD
uniref:Photosystem II reaction center Psb28 protein n=1 Tax=Panagrolaimus sp. JU765 TaxID=591449 RepID=A0AC34Q1E0_9BILA